MIISDRLSQFKMAAIYLMRNEKVIQYMDEIISTENMTQEELWEYKNRKYEELSHYVKNAIPFYEKLQTGNRDKSLCGAFPAGDTLPLVDKDILKRNLSLLVDRELKVSWRSTSGTTGSPFVFPKDKIATGYMDAMMYTAYAWHGIKFGDRQARIWGRAVKKRMRLVQNVKDIVLKRKRLSSFEMTESKCIDYYNQLKNYKPRYFYAYANGLYRFAQVLQACNRDPRELGIRAAICTGEVLFQHQREKIEEVFGCKVINEYGSTENGIIGIECEHGNMHVMPTIKIEVLDCGADGIGDIAITELNSRSMPFIRYKIGDRGCLKHKICPCGRPYEIIEVSDGRIDDYIICPDGKLVYDAILAYTLKEYAQQFKSYQEKTDLLRIYLVPNDDYCRKTEEKIKATLRKYVGDLMNIEVLKVQEIPADSSGKYRYFVSKINKC